MIKLSYREIAAILRQEIMDGLYPHGSLLPPEPVLAERFGTARSAINNTFRVLRGEGLISTQQGRGTYVTAMTSPIVRNASLRYQAHAREQGHGAFDYEVRQLGMTPKSDLTISRVLPPEQVAEILGVSPGGEVLARSRQMYADNVPVQIATSYIPLDIAADTVLEEAEQGAGGMVSRMADLGFQQTRMTERITVRPPSEAEAEFLSMSSEQRVYVIHHVGWTSSNRPVEVCVHVMPTHYWQLDYSWEVDPTSS
ncbi:GntR family transcriptional regulator [Sinosporangium album]|uniref:GntR family transcriptional regulator n=1 Tax=Sinosporangium album TaxID=504805 RepID=A0A1G8LH65_9ACTN|nr:GntR family transcriptional regulator [Sinosporangium album]SDI54958.1 GntR family transcriptional regulator [Sinosporangium album]